MRLRTSKIGFTLVELMVVMSIMSTLLGFVIISLTTVAQKASVSTTVQTVISDLNAQKIKAMVGDTGGRALASSYGVHFDTTQYVLFNGSAYSSSDASNFVISLPGNLRFTTSGINIVFSKTSGELSLPATITIDNVTNNEEKTIEINRYGVVTDVN